MTERYNSLQYLVYLQNEQQRDRQYYLISGHSRRYRERRSDSSETLSEGRDLIQDKPNPTIPVSVFDIPGPRLHER